MLNFFSDYRLFYEWLAKSHKNCERHYIHSVQYGMPCPLVMAWLLRSYMGRIDIPGILREGLMTRMHAPGIRRLPIRLHGVKMQINIIF